jgi:hypothetical protein
LRVTNVAPIAATISAAATDNAPTLLPLSKPPEVNDTAPVPPFPARVPETSAPPRAIACDINAPAPLLLTGPAASSAQCYYRTIST